MTESTSPAPLDGDDAADQSIEQASVHHLHVAEAVASSARSEVLGVLLNGLRDGGLIAVHEVWATRPPAPVEHVARAAHAAGLTHHGVASTVIRAHGVAAATVQTGLNGLSWMVGHPGRLALAVMVLGVLLTLPWSRHLVAAALELIGAMGALLAR